MEGPMLTWMVTPQLFSVGGEGRPTWRDHVNMEGSMCRPENTRDGSQHPTPVFVKIRTMQLKRADARLDAR